MGARIEEKHALPRASGVLAHPTSFPGRHGIGDLGDAAFRFVDWLVIGGQRFWQVLPLNPIGPGNSPYASPSAFAANPLLISLDWLAGDGLLTPADVDDHPRFSSHEVDFPSVAAFKTDRLRRAYAAFVAGHAPDRRAAFDAFVERHAHWLADYALYESLKDAHGGRSWTTWEPDLVHREPAALDRARASLADDVRFHEWVQFQVRRQWDELRRYANDRDVRIIGDLPIFVAHDSADVWAHQDLFRLDAAGQPILVAGVPPDAFTDQGQLWGNPMYDWPANRRTGFAWWIDRVRATLDLVDLIRIDHFRGFLAAWGVPADALTAATGHWVRGPGEAIFDAMRQALGSLPFIVEDLGLITPDVVKLRTELGLPGMKVLQFAFDTGPDNAYLPHNFERDCVVYPATHDNQTTIGWFQTRSEWERHNVQRYLGRDGSDIAWDFIRLALASVADLAVLPLQDIMRLGDEARMNTPGRAEGNWTWRYQAHQLHQGLGAGLGDLTATYGRRSPLDRAVGVSPFDYTTPDSAYRLAESDAP
jgi:4-alpha-glucanotransferase